jgi:thiamine biosynthesis lipoprotein
MGEQQHSRRDFLRGRAALKAVAETVETAMDKQLGETASPEAIRSATQVLTLTRRAMACEFEIRLNTSRQENDTAAAMAALDLIERLEDQLTIYRKESELIDLNRRAATEPVLVEQRLFELFELCGRVHKETNGAFDPTSGPLSDVWGFSRRQGRRPELTDLDAARRRVGWWGVSLDADKQTMAFHHEGLSLNVNSIGKGYALDRAGELLLSQGVANWITHGGRSTLLARGYNEAAGDSEDEGGRPIDGWLAGIRDPLRPEKYLAQIVLRDEALSTSGGGTQFFEHEGNRYSHVLDPRTGWPAKGLLQATAIAPTAAEADALSTAFYVLGVEGTAEFCQRRPDVRALLVACWEREGKQEVMTHKFNFV